MVEEEKVSLRYSLTDSLGWYSQMSKKAGHLAENSTVADLNDMFLTHKAIMADEKEARTDDQDDEEEEDKYDEEEQDEDDEEEEDERYSQKWLDKRGKLVVPQAQTWIIEKPTLRVETPAPVSAILAVPPTASSSKRKRGKRGSRTDEDSNKRTRSGFKHAGSKDDPEGARLRSLEIHHMRKAVVFSSTEFSVLRNGNRSSTGWSGAKPPKMAGHQIVAAWTNGTLGEQLKNFQLIHFSPLSTGPTVFLDADRRRVMARTGQLPELVAIENGFWLATEGLLLGKLGPGYVAPYKSPRGKHGDFILGHYRPYQAMPIMTEFQATNDEAIKEYLKVPAVAKIVEKASGLLRMYFPGVAARYQACVDWHKEKYGFTPLFDLFFNFCINGALYGQPRVHCAPHADWKNAVGICILIVYQIPGTAFNHKARSWLCIWEAGVVIELPPWVALLYPSSLFYHFNVDIQDAKIITTPDGKRPTRDKAYEETFGRGSLVFFNQAAMMQSSETGCGSLKEAADLGIPTTTDFGAHARTAFPKHAKYVPVDASVE